MLNPDTDPVEGYSNFAWMLLVLPFCASGADPTWPVKLLSLLLAGITICVLPAAGDRLFGPSRVPGHDEIRALAAVGLAAFTPYVLWAVSGMENVLYVAALTLALYFYTRESLVACAAALCVLALTRVEGIGLAGVFVAHRGLILILDRRGPSPAERRALLVLVLAYGTYTAWHWWWFRAWVPNTYLAKAPSLEAGGAIAQLLDLDAPGWRYLADSFFVRYNFITIAPFLVMPFATMPLRSALLLVMLVFGATGLVVLTGGDFYPEFRLGSALLPLAFLLLAEGARVATVWIRLRPVAFAVAAVVVAIVCLPSAWTTPVVAAEKPISFRGLKSARVDMYVDLARRSGRSRVTIMESDIGALAYFTDFPIVDLGGLANLHVARFHYYAPFFLPYIFDQVQPEILSLRGNWARHANVPPHLVEADYVTIEGRTTGPYAEGVFLRRDLAAALSPPAADPVALADEARHAIEENAVATAVDRLRALRAICGEGAVCPDLSDIAAAAAAGARHARARRAFDRAFELLRVATLAAPTNVALLRHREDMRLAAAGLPAYIALRKFPELRALYREMLDAGWRPSSARELLDFAEAIGLTGLDVDDEVVRHIENCAGGVDDDVRAAAMYAYAQVLRAHGREEEAAGTERKIGERWGEEIDSPAIGQAAFARGLLTVESGSAAEVVVFLESQVTPGRYTPFLRLYAPGTADYVDVAPLAAFTDAHATDRLLLARFQLPPDTTSAFAYLGATMHDPNDRQTGGIAPLGWIGTPPEGADAAEGAAARGFPRIEAPTSR